MSNSVLLSMLVLILVPATVPLLVELLALTAAALFPKRHDRLQRGEPETLQLTVLVPAHNEQGLIGRCVQSVKAFSDPGVEILVVAHNCTDGTAAEALANGARVLPLNDPAQTGKGCALRYGFAAVLAGSSQAAMVIDGDSVVGPETIGAVRRSIQAGAQVVQCRYEVLNNHNNQRIELMALAFRAFNILRPRGRGRLGLSVGILGNGFAVSKEVIERVPYEAHSVVEDLEYHLNLIQAGICVEFLDNAVVRGEMPASDRGARTQRARWEGGRQRMMKHWTPKLLAGVLRGQTRLIEPLLDLLALPIATEVLLLLIAACLPVLWIRLYVIAAFLILMFHVAVAATLGDSFLITVRALASVPGYIAWKLRVFPEIWRSSRSSAAWLRTERDLPSDSQ